MNPSILFGTSSNKYLIVRVKPAAIAPHLVDAAAFNKLIMLLAAETKYDVINGGHKALPLGSELSGRWMGASPMGQEFSTPPAAWCFEERIALATTETTHPLMVIPATGFTAAKAKKTINHVLGTQSVVSVEDYRERTALDEVLDNLDGDGFEGYN